MADARVRRHWIRRCIPPRRSATGAVHVVVESRAGVEKKRRMAHRLPDRDTGHCIVRARGVDLQEPPLLRSRAAPDRLRFRIPLIAATRRLSYAATFRSAAFTGP